jgi:hypothetical protein
MVFQNQLDYNFLYLLQVWYFLANVKGPKNSAIITVTIKYYEKVPESARVVNFLNFILLIH